MPVYKASYQKEKPSKISNIIFSISPFYQKKKISKLMTILSTLESITLDETIRWTSKCLILK